MEERGVVLLVGLPCAGKSTFARNLELAGWTSISEEKCHSLHLCKGALSQAFSKRKNVVIDGQNLDVTVRRDWINLIAQTGQGKFYLWCVFIKTPIEVCKERSAGRDPNANEKIAGLLQNFAVPDFYEGFSDIFVCDGMEAISDAFEYLTQPRPYDPMILFRNDRAESSKGNHRAEILANDGRVLWHGNKRPKMVDNPVPPPEPWRRQYDVLVKEEYGRFLDKKRGKKKKEKQKKAAVTNPPCPKKGEKMKAPLPEKHFDENLPDKKIILLFDLNGTLTCRTQKRMKKHLQLRPHVRHLLKLKDKFRLGIFSSSTSRTVSRMHRGIQQELGQDNIFDFCLHREHTVSLEAREGGNAWDTQKPICKWFKNTGRVLLIDDDSYKAFRGEEMNMVLVPSWTVSDKKDRVIEQLVDGILNVLGEADESVDVRNHTDAITSMLKHQDRNGTTVAAGPSSVMHALGGDRVLAGNSLQENLANGQHVQDVANAEEIPLSTDDSDSGGDLAFIPVGRTKRKRVTNDKKKGGGEKKKKKKEKMG